MEPRNEIVDELLGLGSSLASMSRTMPYFVPENYFENLCHNIQQNVNVVDVSDPLFAGTKEIPYAIPLHYFDELPAQVLGRAKENSEALKNNPYAVPRNYFDALPDQMLRAAKASKDGSSTKIIPLGGRSSLFYIRLAVAALLIAAIGFGTFKYFAVPASNPEIALAKIPDSLLKDYAQQNFDDFEVYMNVNNLVANKEDKYTRQLSPQDIEQYLDEVGLGQKNIE